jgi:GNAT superfamily N-acetyltransferase
MPKFRIEALSAGHDRDGFSCGAEPLDRFFRQQVTQDIRRRATSCFVAVDEESGRVAGFYTLASGAVALTDLPEPTAKRLPRYPFVPVARLGRLAVELSFQGFGLGGALLWDAVARASRSELMAFALLVDAKDDQAARFYIHHGFVELGDRRLILPLGKNTFA